MGGAQSLFQENDWDLADGGLLDSSNTNIIINNHQTTTIDGAEPTLRYGTYFMIKKAVLANQREFDVIDSTSNLLFHVRPSLGTIAGFDVLGVGSAAADDYRLRVTVDLARRQWIVYRFDKPAFEGQMHDLAATEKFATDLLPNDNNRKTTEQLAARISASLSIHSFAATDDEITRPTSTTTSKPKDPALSPTAATDAAASPRPHPPQPLVIKHHLYKVCCVTVSWSRYMAVAAYFGPPTVEQLLESQKHKEAIDELDLSGRNDDDDEHGGDLLLEASKIAERMRDRKRRSLLDEDDEDANEDDKDLAKEEDEDSVAKTHDSETIPIVATTVQGDARIMKSNETHHTMDVATTTAKVDSTNALGPTTDDDASVVAANGDNAIQKSDSSSIATQSREDGPEPELGVPPEPPLAALADGDTDASSNSATEPPKQALTAAMTFATLGMSQSNDPATAANTTLASAENRNVDDIDETNSHDDTIPDVQTSVSMPELSKDSSSTTPLNAEKLKAWFKETSRSIHTKSKSFLQQSYSSDDVDNSAILGMSTKIAKDDDPLEGVIQLDKPLLLCQEIYTRIIGNHQTSRVSKAQVLTLLKQDMEQKIESEAVDLDNNKKGPALKSVNANTDTTEASTVNPVVLSQENGDQALTADTTASTAAQQVTDDSPLEAVIEAAIKPQPLVGYWAWEHSLRTHKIKMHLAKGSDLALHVVLAVLVNQVRYERNAIAIAV